MPPRSPTITEVADLLAHLHAKPTHRAVAEWPKKNGKKRENFPALVEFETTDPIGAGRFIAWIKPGSPAALLLLAVHDAYDDAYAGLPLRECLYSQTYVLPEHPSAVKPGERDIPF
jgi:hypothetical protein